MPNGDEEKGQSKAKKNIKKLGSLSRRRGILPSDVSGRNISLGTALTESNWPGTNAHSSTKRGKSDEFKKGYNSQLEKQRGGAKKVAKKILNDVKNQNLNRAREMSGDSQFSSRNKFKSEDNERVSKPEF